MNRFGFITLIALFATSCAQHPKQPTNLEQDIRQELNALGQAVVQRDAAAIDRLVADDFTFTQPDAMVSGKNEMLAVTKSEIFVYEQHEVAEIKVRGYEITAVSNGQFMVRARYKGQSMSHSVQFTSVHVREAGRWQLVALHSTIKEQ